TRTFDELALLLPGVAPAPQAIGGGAAAGPGVGAGVGSAGQFSSNGMPPRSNNFTVDGSDNNDEDIGVRRQGFLALVPQPIESIKEYQVITLLAPAQFGRNIGAQVNAISKSGGNQFHGEFYGLFNSNHLNARNHFDTSADGTPSQLTTGTQRVFVQNFSGTAPASFSAVAGTRRAFNVQNPSGGEDSFTLGQGGFALGGPIKQSRLFFFVSAERQILNATQERSFAVPTVVERGFDNSGASGLARDRFALQVNGLPVPGGQAVSLGPQNLTGAAFLSLFPFPNNPAGVYGANTFTQVLPASGRGTVASGKIDYINPASRLLQSFTARYNFTDDWRDIPAAGGAIFATLRPEVRTQNISTFFNSELSGPGSMRPVFNQLRLSYGRTRLDFEERRDSTFLLPSQQTFADRRFLLNAPVIQNVTLPASPGVANTGDVNLAQLLRTNGSFLTTEDVLGPIGQVVIAGFSPVGVDVFNFPQSRVNNTYQLADTLTIRSGSVSYAFGADIRRTELNSDLPRNARALATFSGAPALQNNPAQGGLAIIDPSRGIPFISPTTFAAAGVPTGFFQALTTAGNQEGNLGLRFYQLNFFGQEEIRLMSNLSLSFGVRYEYNTVPREQNDRLENAFQAISGNQQLNPGAVASIIAGRTRVFEPDRNNIAPRVGFAWSPNVFGPDHETVFRGGFGVYYDQILGAVVSQSRNIYPAFLPLNFSTINVGGTNTPLTAVLPSQLRLSTTNTALAPAGPCIFVSAALTPTCLSGGQPLLAAGTLNTFNFGLLDQTSQSLIINALSNSFPNSFGFTLPSRRLDSPMAYHYSYSWEQRLTRSMVASLAYAGTTGRNLLRITTPFL
ncbi:MAG TPA: hypothetical protein VGV38_23375, partial [Pyrinomonadaceae bacterium]|nr:hypothetical protein [Pyrinomonadaceae bacterium]